MLAEKERLVTIDRFPWQGGIQINVASWQRSQGTQLQCPYSQSMMSVISENRCVSFMLFTFDC